MRTVANELAITGYRPAGAGFERVAPAKGYAGNALRGATNIALFCAAPFIALAYVVAFPLVGLAVLAWIGARALLKR